MKLIPLTKGMFAKVDDEDYEWLSQHKWKYSNGYAVKGRSKNKNFVQMHRILSKTPDGMETDHVDGDKLNNQKSNLRPATTSQNQQNKSIQKNNTSGYKGVSWNKQKRKWRTRVYLMKKEVFCKHFLDITEAAEAYDKEALRLFGRFARLNFPAN